ncbi:MAG: hypothetical protein VXZ72_03005 [Chlamydiota bacterium]|nr:hypothetical protein [Chlamydiota bacterium]
MKFKCSCAKCGSMSVYLESDPRVSWENDKILRCYMCGWAVYGQAAVEAELDKQYTAFLKDKRKATKVLKPPPAPVPKPVPTADPIHWEVAHAEEQARRKASGICANVECSNKARETSAYCSRKCCVRNAHYREHKRKEDARNKRAPSIAA